ncbi:hypothetical protein J6590_089406, partial [Homalodisca vitripennis]
CEKNSPEPTNGGLKKAKSGAGPFKKAKWFAFDLLHFLRDKTNPHHSRDSEEIQQQSFCQGTEPSSLMKYALNSWRIAFASLEGFLGTFFSFSIVPGRRMRGRIRMRIAIFLSWQARENLLPANWTDHTYAVHSE